MELVNMYKSISVQSDSYDYTVRRATEKDSGNYSCSGIDSAGAPFIATAEVVVGSKFATDYIFSLL